MKNLVVIVGLPGSGKTNAAQNYSDFLDYIVFDDVGNDEYMMNKLYSYLTYWKDLDNDWRSGVVVTDTFLCEPKNRSSFQKKLNEYGLRPTWLFFENDPEQCIKNVQNRNDGRKISASYIRELSKKYVIPAGASVVPVAGKRYIPVYRRIKK